MSLVNMLIAALMFASLQQLLVVGTYSDTYGAYRDDAARPTPTTTHHHHHRHQHFVTATKASNQVHSHPHHHHQHGFKHHHQQQQQQQQQHQTPWLRYQQQFKFSAAASTKPTTIKATHKKQHSQQRQQQPQQSLPTSTAHSGHKAAHASLRGHSLPSSHQARVNTTTASLNDNQAQTSSPSPPSTFSPEASQAALKHAHHLRSSAGDAADHQRPRSKSSESDYADDYYDDDVELDDDEYEDEDAANELGEGGSTARGGLAGRKLHAGHHLDEEQLLAPDEDYADDEPYRSSAEVYQNDAPGILTDQKFRELGTLEAVQQSRDKYLMDQERMRQKTPAEHAREHMDRMKTAGRCSRPLPRVIHVSNETSKRYVPYCTILHRCGEDTGCCDSTRQVCAAKSFEDVPVYFFVIKVSSRSNKRDTELLMLRNHTECHCVDRSILSASMQFMPRDKRSDLSHPRYHLHQHHRAAHLQEQLQEQHQALVLPHSSEPAEAANTICRCPKHFDVFPEDVPLGHRSAADALRCRCDCLSHNLPCHRLQSGEEGFAVDERKCIAESGCQAPVCLHGDYDRHTGRCPRRKNHKLPLARYDYGYG